MSRYAHLLGDLDNAHAAVAKALRELLAENARLRAALELIEEGSSHQIHGALALAALAGEDVRDKETLERLK